MKDYFTPIPCTYTSSPLDGISRNYHFHFYLRGYARPCNFVGSGSVFILPPYTREKKPFGQSWDQSRLATSASEQAIHYAIASRAKKIIKDILKY